MKKILVAVDGSEKARKAAAKALEIAKSLSAEVTIIFVAAPIPSPIHWSGNHFYHEEMLEKQKEQAKEILDNYKNYFSKENIDAYTLLEEGDPAEEICKAATSDDFYMVVMGSKGLTGIKRALIGSVANYVVQSCKVPVLVVK